MNPEGGSSGPALQDRLTSRSFVCLVAAQMLGALNDNMFRWLAVPVAGQFLGAQGAQTALSIGLFCFTLPYLLFATHAGFLADRFSKTRVIIYCKFAEIVIMALGLMAIRSGQPLLLFGAIALMGAQSALFGPAKFGSIPELVSTNRISAANGVMGLVTVSASAVGTIAGLWLFSRMKPDSGQAELHDLWIAGLALVGVAVAGWLISLGIRRLPPAQPGLAVPVNPVLDTWRQLRLLGANAALLRTALGIAFFWTLASLAQMNIAVYGQELRLNEADVGKLLGVLVLGVGLGSVLAGIWSGGRIELGIVPLGAAGIVLGSLSLFVAGSGVDLDNPVATGHAYYWSCAWLFVLGASAGLFSVPLDSFLQHRSPADVRGAILAASNFVSFTGILIASGMFYLMQNWLHLSAKQTFLAAGLGTIPVLLYVVTLLPQATIRFAVWLASHTIYRVRVYGRENLPETGGALLVANHVTWVDGILLLISSSRPIRMLAFADYVHGSRMISFLSRIFGVIPVNGNAGPKALLLSLQTARQAIMDGDLVCIFAEGSLTRTGQLQPFQRGLLRIVDGTHAPVVPTYLDGLWGSIFSFHGGKFFWKRPRKWPYPVGILFGRPLENPDDVHQVREAVENLGVVAVEKRKDRELPLARRFLRNCRRSMLRPKVADSSGEQLTGSQLLLKALILRRVLTRQVLHRDEKLVGVLLPPSLGGVLVNAALPLCGRAAVNLNYTTSAAVMNSCIAQCQIKHVLTSRKVVDRLKLTLDAEFVYVEDFKDRLSILDKLTAAFQTFVTPVCILDRLFRLTRVKLDDLLTIVFTSGSTGEPKGVMLSNQNVISNIEAIDQLFQLDKQDAFLGVLPLFHSMGFTATMWSVLTLAPKGIYHFNPLDARQIGALCHEHKVTIMIATPTFLRSYLKRCEPEQFKSMDLVVVGAEKMPIDLAQAFEDKFHVRPIEGYGTTELSPLAAVNVPDHRSAQTVQKGTKEGTVGRPIVGVAVKVVDPETGANLGLNQPGLLLVKGPNVMQGYLNKPELTAEVLRDGWYNTGDIARIDDEGFIQITDRQSRFSKIGGEMVPHIKVQEILAEILRAGNSDDQELYAVVTAVPDEAKGERLVVIHKPLNVPLDDAYAALRASGLPNLWVPSRDSFLQVDELPVLGTGKLDLKGLKTLALEKFGPAGVGA